LEARNSRDGSDIYSPPLTPLSLTDLSQQQGTKTTAGGTRMKGKMMYSHRLLFLAVLLA
jgi:hypothetical protein